MATTISHAFTLDTQPHHHRHHHALYRRSCFKPQKPAFLTANRRYPSFVFPKFDHRNVILSFSASPFSSSSTSIPALRDPLHAGRFLTNEEFEKLQFLENFKREQELGSGFMWVRVMRQEEMEMTVALLAESFAESMLLPVAYETVLRFLVKQYLVERRTIMPHTATLVGFYRAEGEKDEQLAGTIEVSFNTRGANSSPPTPIPPKNSPYICNMTVKKHLRRKGIGWHLLKASEELISQMSSSREVYLHCRMIDEAPLNMYTRAGYSIVKTDNIVILFLLQRRKHLMCKKLPAFDKPSEAHFWDPDEELTS